jgi:uncharacterized UPF0160 family protein
MKKCIVTHPGEFHCDEVLAVVTFKWLTGLELPIERRVPTPQDLDDPNTLVFDIGREFNPEKGNFDHHQDPGFPATNVLVLEHFCNKTELKAGLRKALFDIVSDADRGIAGKIPGSVNGLIRNLNAVHGGFEIALDVMDKLLLGVVTTTEKALRDQERWQKLPKDESGLFKISEGDLLVGWKELAKEEGILFLVHPARDGWGITSADTNMFQIPSDPRQNFLHNARFTASYGRKEDALDHARELVR